MSTQTRNSGGGGRNKNKPNSTNHNGSSGGGKSDTEAVNSATHQTSNNTKKSDPTKPEKEKVHPKPTAEQLRIAQITNTNTSEDPQMREKVATLIEMTQRSEEEVCCALYECDNNLERAVVFLLEFLPVGAFETSSKKKKNKAATTTQDVGAGDGGEWTDSNANNEKREKSRNRNSNRGGRGGTDSRGWRGREARENERNLRESRGDRGAGGENEERNNENYRGQRGAGGGGRGGRSGYAGRGGRGGGRMGGGGRGGSRGDRGDRGVYSRSRQNFMNNDEHQEMELWDNAIAQNAEKQQHHQQDDTWGDWDNEEYVGSLKDSKVFTTSNINSQTAASVLSAGLGGASGELSAPPGLEHHLGTSVLGGNNNAGTSPQQGSHLNALVGSGVNTGLMDDSSGSPSSGVQTVGGGSTMMQYSAAVSNPAQLGGQQAGGVGIGANQQYSAAGDPFANASTAAANLVQQVQQQQQAQMKTSATLSAEQSQYFNSLASQNAAGVNSTAGGVQPNQMAAYAQGATVQYPQTFASVFSASGTAGNGAGGDQGQIATGQQTQVRRARAKVPPPSKIPATAVEMPGDTLNNIGYLDVQFGGLDFGTDDSFDTLSDKFNTSVTIDSQQQQQQQQAQDLNDYQNNKSSLQQQQQQQTLSSGLQNSQLSDTLSSTAYVQRSSIAQQQMVSGGSNVNNSALDQLKNDPYNQTNTNSASSGYQTGYQGNTSNKNVSGNAYQAQSYNSTAYTNVQGSVANTYQTQTPYSAYQQNSVNSYQQQQQAAQQSQSGANNATGLGSSAGAGSNSSNSNSVGVVTNSNGAGSSTQNIPVGNSGSSSNNNATASGANAGYLSSGYASAQQSAYQNSQSVFGGSSTGYSGSTSTSTSQYSNFSTSAKLKDVSTTSSTSHYDTVSTSNAVSSSSASGTNSTNATSAGNSGSSSVNNNGTVSSTTLASQSSNTSSTNNNNSSSAASVVAGVASSSGSSNKNNSNSNANASSAVMATNAGSAGVAGSANSITGGGTSSSNATGGAGSGGMVPTNIQMVSQYIQAGMPYYQPPVYTYEELQMIQQRMQHVPSYYDLNYTQTNLGAGRDSVAYSTMTDGRFARTDNNSSPVSSTMSQQAGSGGPMLNVPYATYFYGGMPGGFQYGTPVYPQQIQAANPASGGQFPKPSYNTGYSSTSYDTLSQGSQDYTKAAYQSNVNQQTKSQNVANQPQGGTSSDISTSMYNKGHVALNKVNSYEKQNFHSGTPPPFNMANTQTAGSTSAQPYGMYLPIAATGHHNMIHPPIHQMDGRIHNSSRRDSNSTGQRQQTSGQSKSGTKQSYNAPSYWTGQN